MIHRFVDGPAAGLLVYNAYGWPDDVRVRRVPEARMWERNAGPFKPGDVRYQADADLVMFDDGLQRCKLYRVAVPS